MSARLVSWGSFLLLWLVSARHGDSASQCVELHSVSTAHAAAAPTHLRRESQIGPSPRWRSVSDGPEGVAELARSIGQLEIELEHRATRHRTMSRCTAALVDDSVALTNYHCLPFLGPELEVIAFQLRMNYLSDDAPGVTLPVALAPLETDAELDYALLRVEGEPEAQRHCV